MMTKEVVGYLNTQKTVIEIKNKTSKFILSTIEVVSLYFPIELVTISTKNRFIFLV